MKWQRAKRVNLLIVLMMVLVGLGAIAMKLYPANSALPQGTVEGGFQMGFYDLMSQQKEIYNVRLQTTRGMIMTTITNPNDNRFVLKGKFTPSQKKHGRIYFNLTPIYYSSEQKGLMIDGLVDQLMYSNYWMEPISFNKQSLVVGQNGAIFLYPMHN
ncbi:hypothetical protein ACRUMN_17675 [Kluyvera cryocrescens]|uniref:hypothetical protein n=1 Tax=Kluyvera cryocrescens TaxID=580 RepID=UPI003D7F8E00